ncbi:MAG: hypothetical protein K5865_05360 [Eubacterium sp.]|nr:hypothetical protein [Eubacterium sp.]
MKTNMTERDKKLLVFMLMVVIIVGIGYWGVIPQIKAANAYSSKAEDEEAEQKINRLKIVNASAVEIQADDYRKDIAEQKNEFYQIMTNSEIDRMMTEMAESEGLEIYDLTFNMPTRPSSRLAYENSDLYMQQVTEMKLMEEEDDEDDEDEAMAAVNSGNPSATTEKKSSKGKKKIQTTAEVNEEIMGTENGYQVNTDIYAVPVSMTVGGKISKLNDFLNKIIHADKRILLVSYAWGDYRELLEYDDEGNYIGRLSTTATSSLDSSGVTAEEVENEEVKTVDKKSLTVKIEIYMCDTSAVASDTDAEELPEGLTEDLGD